ncbi:MAG TPA: type I secretion system permease/ATPase [Burkholderiales bacterium]|nr:type I secretion system permease/ATPase [Burkholderiales bacterium]
MNPLWQVVRPLLGSLFALSLFINLLFVVPALYMMQVFDRVLPSSSTDTLVVLLLGTGVALGLLLMLDYVRIRLQHVIGTLVDERLSPPVVNAVVGRTARLPQGASTEGVRDVAALKNVFSANGLVALFDAPWVAVYVAIIWFFHPALGMGAAAAACLMLLLAWLNDRLGRRTLESLQKDGRRASQYVESSLRNAEVLQALGMTASLLARWRSLQDDLAARHTSASRTTVAFTATTRFLRQAVQVGMLSLGAWLVLSQEASPGIMIATTILLGRAVQPVEQLVGSWRVLTEARAAYGRLRELASGLERVQPRLEIPCPKGRLTVDNVSFRARGSDTPILSGVGFALAAGESLAVLGPSAAGKSTLARLLTGVWAPTSGVVRLDGADVADWPREQLGPWIGYVPQDVELFDGTVAENIARLGPVDSEAVVAAAQRANAHELILSLPQGYETPVGEHGARLSPGQRQRVALARALFGNPRLVILDEPNSNLDGAGEQALAGALVALRERETTTVVITHRPSLIAHVDKVLVLAAGRVQQFGPPSQVFPAMKVVGQRAA